MKPLQIAYRMFRILVSLASVQNLVLIQRFIIILMNKSYLIAGLLATIALLAVYHHEEAKKTPYSFEQYKADYAKTYTKVGQEEYRKTIFLKNLVKIAEHNANSENTWQKGVNQFTDLTDAQFEAIYLTLRVPLKTSPYIEKIETPSNGDIDWSAAGVVTRVKNQGACGSCWAFSATGALESAIIVSDRGQKPDLSEQDLVDCSRNYGNMGCNGGWMDSAFNYIKDNGIATENDYPYTARDGSCQNVARAQKLVNFVDVPGCANLRNALDKQPIAVAVDASIWSSYRSGVMNNCGTAINHGVLVVGASDDFWKIKNSWGNTWGEGGYIRLAPGSTCAVCDYPSYPVV